MKMKKRMMTSKTKVKQKKVQKKRKKREIVSKINKLKFLNREKERGKCLIWNQRAR